MEDLLYVLCIMNNYNIFLSSSRNFLLYLDQYYFITFVIKLRCEIIITTLTLKTLLIFFSSFVHFSLYILAMLVRRLLPKKMTNTCRTIHLIAIISFRFVLRYLCGFVYKIHKKKHKNDSNLWGKRSCDIINIIKKVT